MAFVWKEPKDIFKGEGIYHLTFRIVNNRHILGSLRPLDHNSNNGHIAYIDSSDLGIAVYRKFNELRLLYPQLEILAKQCMENHFHAVIWMHEGFEGSVKMLARGFAQGCSKEARRLYAAQAAGGAQAGGDSLPSVVAQAGGDSLPSVVAQSNCAIMDSAHPTPDSAHQTPDSAPQAPFPLDPYECGNGAHTLFETPFIRTLCHKHQLANMIKYVHANPDNAWRQKMNPDLYVIRRNREYAGLHFDIMGKDRLLDYPDRQIIALSRSLTEEQIEAEVRKALWYAEQGVVTYTAAIAKGEKAVARAVREAGYPLVIMMLDGFPAEGTEAARYFHPSGVYHTACGEGRLHLMAPLPENYDSPELIARTEAELRKKAEAKNLRYSPIPNDSKRWRMVAGNVMLKMIAGE